MQKSMQCSAVQVKCKCKDKYQYKDKGKGKGPIESRLQTSRPLILSAKFTYYRTSLFPLSYGYNGLLAIYLTN